MATESRLRHVQFVALVVLIVISFLTFSPVLGFDLLWDDLKIATDQLKYRVDDAQEFNEQLKNALPFSPNYWRPVPMATFLWQINAGLGSPLLMHLASLVLHCLNVAVLFKLLGLVAVPDSWSPRAAVAIRFGIAAIFATHPVLVEPVAWVSSRFDLMMTLFALLLLLVLFGMRQSRQRLGLVFLLTLAALLCKEQAVMLLLAFPFLVVVLGQGEIRRTGWQRVDLDLDRRAYAIMVLALLVYLGLRWNALGYLLLPESLGFDLDPLQHLLLFGATAFHAWGLMLAPFGWAGEFHYLGIPVDTADPGLWLQAVPAYGLMVLTAFVLLTRPKVSPAGAALAVVWLFLLPVINLKPLVTIAANMLIGERFLVLPLALLCVGAYAILTRARIGEHRIPIVAPVILGAFVAGSILASRGILPAWQSEFGLWQAWLESAPRVTWLKTNVSRELLIEERYTEAEVLANAAVAELEALPTLSLTRRWELGRSLSTASIAAFELGHTARAIDLMEQAAKKDPTFASLYRSLLARYQLRLGNVAAAERQMVHVVRLTQYQEMKRMHSVSYINLALIALDRRDYQSAGLLFREGYYSLSGGSWAANLPEHPEAWRRLGDDLEKAKLPRAAASAREVANMIVASRRG